MATKEVKPHAEMAAAPKPATQPAPVPPTPAPAQPVKVVKPFYPLGEGSEPETA